MTRILGAIAYAGWGAAVLGFLPVMGASHVRHRGDPTQRKPGRWMRRLGRVMTRLTPLWDFHVEGEPPADIGTRAYVVVANHESNADPFLLAHLPWDMRWIAKEELFEVPLVGLAFRFGGDVAVRRGKGESVRAMLTECRKALDGGISVMVFPEGTRSRTGELLPFKDGAFSLAIAAGVPVLPLAIAGTRDCLRKGSFWPGRARAAVKIIAPIDGRGLTTEALRDRARAAIAEALVDLRARYGHGHAGAD